MSEEIDHNVAAYMASVAAALEALPKCETSYGEFFISEARVAFDGEETSYAVVANEHGGYSIALGLAKTEKLA